MNLPDLLNRFKQSFAGFWAARDARERAMLAAAAVVIALGLTFAALIDPALGGRSKLDRSLPELRQQVAQLQVLAQEAASYSASAAAPLAAISADSIKAGLEAKGLQPQNVTLVGGLAKVQLSAASFSATVNWLDEMQKTMRLTVIDANFVALDKPDTVNAALTLRQQRNE